MWPVLQFRRFAAQKPKLGLVHEGCALQGVIRPFVLQMTSRHAPQLSVNQG
jgi:hypothetical protein